VTAITPEATGGFETIVAVGLAGAGLPVVIVNPAQVRACLKKSIARVKKALETELAEIDAQIDDHMRASPA
jgi:transposase